MRWLDKELPTIGETRYKFGFLLIPLCLEKETRWLEHTGWVEEYVADQDNMTYWRPIRWIKKNAM